MVSNRRTAAAMTVLVPTPSVEAIMQRLAVARRDRERAAEAAQAADRFGAAGRVDVLAHELDGALARLDVDAGLRGRRTRDSAHGQRPRHRLFEDELAARGVVRDGLRVVAVEAGEAEPLVRQVERGEDAADREVRRACRRR